MTSPAKRLATLDLVTSHRDSSTIVTASGTIDASTAAELTAVISGLLDLGHECIVLDLTSITFLDTAALGAMAVSQTRVMKLEWQLDVVCDRPLQRELFAITGLDQVITLHLDIDSALAAQNSTKPINPSSDLAN